MNSTFKRNSVINLFCYFHAIIVLCVKKERIVNKMNTREILKNDVINDFKKGATTSNLIEKYGLPKSTINDWLRNTRLEIEGDSYKKLTFKYSKLYNDFEKISLELTIYKELNCLPTMERIDRLDAIEKHADTFPIKTMCRILNIDSSTALNHIKRRVKKTKYEINDELLTPLVLDIFNKSKQRFGSNKIADVLKKEGHIASRKKVKTLMNKLNIKPVYAKRRKFIPTENNNKYLINKLKSNFTREHPNEVWVSDITEIYVLGLTFYLCVIIDLFSRKVIAYRVHYQSDANFVCNVLKDGYKNRNEPKNLMFHSDRGKEYTSYKFINLLKLFKIEDSFSNTANPYDNAVNESFFSYLKKGEVYRNDYQNIEELKKSIDEYIHFYNDYRPHSALKGKTPNEFEKEYYSKNR